MLKTYVKGVNQGIQQKLQYLKTWNENNTAYSKTYRAAINKHLRKQLGIICCPLSFSLLCLSIFLLIQSYYAGQAGLELAIFL